MIMGKSATFAWWMTAPQLVSVLERMLTIHFKVHTGFVTIIAVYVPTNEIGNEEESRESYHAVLAGLRE